MSSQSSNPQESSETHDALELTHELSRRSFLRLSGLSLLSLGLPVHWRRPQLELLEGPLARIFEPSAEIYSQPSFAAEKLETCLPDDLLPIDMAVFGDAVPEHNRIWYLIRGRGFLHSSSAQPVRNRPNASLDLPMGPARLMEVTVPFTDAHRSPRTSSSPSYRLYYSTMHWISGSIQDEFGSTWYRVEDPRVTYDYYAPAEAFRPIVDDEIAPISPDVPPEEKRIYVDLAKQWLKCFEADKLCFMTRVSTGKWFDIGDYTTKPGTFPTRIKRPSRHMVVGPSAGGYDIPGVSWVNYFNHEGDALHGVYWHNDYGNPQSHGCVNLTPKAAKWIFRWTLPTIPADLYEIWINNGTTIEIHS
jgi:lipoprotein-anchoring transpeptidase ErfK/SrfK